MRRRPSVWRDLPVAAWGRYRWTLIPLGVFAVTRIFTTAWLVIGAERQVALVDTGGSYHVTVPTEASPGYLGVVSNWDGQWYRSIAETGYPRTLPMEGGHVIQNEWAFLPGYPVLVRSAMWVTHASFPLAATIVSLVCSAIALVLLYRMVMTSGDQFAAFTVILGLCVFPTSPVLQVAYAESLALLLLVLALVLLGSRRYAWLVPVMVLLSVTRQLVLVLAVLIGLHWISRYRRSAEEPFPTPSRVGLGALTVLAVGLSGLWAAIAGVVTGRPAAYIESHAAWLPGSRPGLAGSWLAISITNLGLLALVLPVITYVVVVALHRGASAWGSDLRSWSIVYPVYLLAATRPSASVMRHLMLSVGPLYPSHGIGRPAGTAPGRPIARVMRVLLPLVFAVVCISGQYYWVTRVFTIDGGSQLYP